MPPDRSARIGGQDEERNYAKYATAMRIILEGARAETGQTPKEVVWTKNKARLYRYVHTAEQRHRVPILLIYALINRPYVLDLMPGNSFVEHLVGQGFDVYMLDWGVPGDEDRDLSFDDYVLDYLPRAVKKVRTMSGTEETTLFGYCMGGTMATMYAAIVADPRVRNLVLLSAPIDFSSKHAGLFGLWTNEKYFDPDRVVEAFGNVPAELIDVATRMLKPVTNYVGPHVALWERLNENKSIDSWLAMNKWVSDGVPFAGEAFRQWIRDLYQQNKLVAREFKLRGQLVDLSKISCSVLSIAARRDHIVPFAQSRAATDLVTSEDKEFLVLDGGHVGLLTGSQARNVLWPTVEKWLEPRSS